ncbi:hypothetical protein M0L20_28490 [Spirosoma sp. RP8]|uniref:Uncharacterized protein n=1 Tax=Spirosoma liriopis TaxID=2937440 RepID=A0ABT0HUK8_9BACT|nr:hypothetical protein [Spirosoma liriopis]MCK8495838.1 hypothetical protein [Spirosoma liriopis]
MDPLRENTRQLSNADDHPIIQDSLLITCQTPAPILTVGDTVTVNAGIKPPLVFTITEMDQVADQQMACGEYGCFAVELLSRC